MRDEIDKMRKIVNDLREKVSKNEHFSSKKSQIKAPKSTPLKRSIVKKSATKGQGRSQAKRTPVKSQPPAAVEELLLSNEPQKRSRRKRED